MRRKTYIRKMRPIILALSSKVDDKKAAKKSTSLFRDREVKLNTMNNPRWKSSYKDVFEEFKKYFSPEV